MIIEIEVLIIGLIFIWVLFGLLLPWLSNKRIKKTIDELKESEGNGHEIILELLTMLKEIEEVSVEKGYVEIIQIVDRTTILKTFDLVNEKEQGKCFVNLKK